MTDLRTFGGWRPRRGYGVGKLSEAQTAVVAGCVLIPLGCWMVVATVGLPLVVMIAVLAVAAVVAALTIVLHRGRDREPLAERGGRIGSRGSSPDTHAARNCRESSLR
jgi:hypothetical protein